MQKIIITSFIALLSFSAMSQDNKMAIFHPAGNANNEVKDIVRETISEVVVNSNDYIVLERAQIDKVIDEILEPLNNPMFDEKTAVRAGKLLGANIAIVSTVTRGGNNYFVSIKMIEVETARITKQITGETAYISEMKNLVQRLARNMFGKSNTVDLLYLQKRTIVRNGQVLSGNQLREVVGTAAHNIYTKSYSQNRSGNRYLIFGVASLGVGSAIYFAQPFEKKVDYMDNGNPHYRYESDEALNAGFAGGIALVGAAMVLTGTTLKISSKTKLKNIVDSYNNSQRTASAMELKFDLTGNGIRLTLAF